jgi:hypothetical protein
MLEHQLTWIFPFSYVKKPLSRLLNFLSRVLAPTYSPVGLRPKYHRRCGA